MKRQTILSTLAGITLAATGFVPAALATENGTGTAAHPPKFDEAAAAGATRGVRLDELFDVLRKEKAAPAKVTPAATTSVQPKTAVKPTAKKAVSASASGAGAGAGTGAGVSAAVSLHKKPQPTAVKHAVASTKNNASTTVSTAEYRPTPGAHNAMLAVSSGGGASQTPIISAKLDKPGALPRYKSGDRMTVKLTAAADCNVLVFDYDSNGTLTQLYPNEFEPVGLIRAGQTIEIGGAESKYTLDVAGKGLERIFVYAYPTSEQPITVAMNPIPHTPFRSVEITPEQYKKLVNNSKTYFTTPGHDRGVKVTAKTGAQNVATTAATADHAETQPNKLELTFQIDK